MKYFCSLVAAIQYYIASKSIRIAAVTMQKSGYNLDDGWWGWVLRNMGGHGALTMKPTKLFGTALGALVLY